MSGSMAGQCDRCGGPQNWTIHEGEMWVACLADCTSRQLSLLGRDPPLIALCEKPEETPNRGGHGTLPWEEGKIL